MATFKGKVLLGELEIDATISEQHTISVDVTEFPVERGANIADHKRVKPSTIRVEGVVSNTPIAVADRLPVNYSARGQTAFEYLERLRDSRELVTIVTALRIYENMALIDVQIPRDAKTGDVFYFVGQFKQVRIVDNRTVVVVTTRAPNGQPLDKKGAQPTKEADEALKNKTIAKRLADTELGNSLLKSVGLR